MALAGSTPATPPEKQDDHAGDHDRAQVNVLYDSNQGVPISAEKVADARDHAHPYDRTQKIPEGELGPIHVEHASEGTGNNTHAGDEACKEDGGRAVTLEEPLAALDSAAAEAEDVLVTFEERSAAMVADPIAQVIANYGRDGCHKDDCGEIKVSFRVRQEAGEKKNGFPGNGQSGIFEEKSYADSRVAVSDQIFAQDLEYALRHCSRAG